jgi:hypothetical protein
MREFRSEFAERSFRQLAQRNVLHCGVVNVVTVLVARGMRHDVQILDRLVGHQQPIVVFEVGPVAQRRTRIW